MTPDEAGQELAKGGHIGPFCRTCYFWRGRPTRLDASHGQCRFVAPVFIQEPTSGNVPQQDAAWPIVRVDDWCGEHKRAAGLPYRTQPLNPPPPETDVHGLQRKGL
jgi:hypothetical protein